MGINNYFKASESNIEKWKNLLNLSNDKINLGIAISGNPNNLKEKKKKNSLRRNISNKKIL